jgi:hydrogenase nickel incorporation protein HypB
MFRASAVLVVTKLDLLPHVDFDVERCIAHARAQNPKLRAMVLSAKTGEGMGAWLDHVDALRPGSAR